MTQEFEPRSPRELLIIVDIIRQAIAANRSPEGLLLPSGLRIVSAALDALEVKLGGDRRGPTAVK